MLCAVEVEGKDKFVCGLFNDVEGGFRRPCARLGKDVEFSVFDFVGSLEAVIKEEGSAGFDAEVCFAAVLGFEGGTAVFVGVDGPKVFVDDVLFDEFPIAGRGLLVLSVPCADGKDGAQGQKG